MWSHFAKWLHSDPSWARISGWVKLGLVRARGQCSYLPTWVGGSKPLSWGAPGQGELGGLAPQYIPHQHYDQTSSMASDCIMLAWQLLLRLTGTLHEDQDLDSTVSENEKRFPGHLDDGVLHQPSTA